MKRPKQELARDREPWERQPQETAKAYEAFVTYRDLGAARSAAKTAEKLGKSIRLIAEWSSQWRWVIRVRAWDDHQHAQREIKLAEQKELAFDNIVALSFTAQRKLMERLNRAMDSGQMSFAEWARMFEVSSKYMTALFNLTGRGDATPVDSENTLAGDVSSLSAEQTRDLLQVAKREIDLRITGDDKEPGQSRSVGTLP